MLVSDLIDKNIRYKVGDVRKATQNPKWSDERIIELLNEGLDDLGQKADIKKATLVMPVLPYQRDLIIPDPNFLRLTRCTINGTPLEVTTFSKMDLTHEWETHIGENLKSIVYDQQTPKNLTLYPLLSETSTTYEALNLAEGILLDVPGVSRESLDGIIVGVDMETFIEKENVYEPTSEDEEGVVVNFSDNFNYLKLNYTCTPEYVESVSDTIDIDKSFRVVLAYYVAGMLLLDDTRSENVNKGLLFLDKYKFDLAEAQSRTAENSQDIDSNTTVYRTPFRR